jgi:hypothetical protein
MGAELMSAVSADAVMGIRPKMRMAQKISERLLRHKVLRFTK